MNLIFYCTYFYGQHFVGLMGLQPAAGVGLALGGPCPASRPGWWSLLVDA